MRTVVEKLASSVAAEGLRRRVAGTPAHSALRRAYAVAVIAVWSFDRSSPPPPQYKIRELRHYARRYGIRQFVETGTFEGDTVAALRAEFDHVWTIELSPELHAVAVDRFASDPGVDVRLGDSATQLPAILADLKTPTLFWLDAHFSEGNTALGDRESPVEVELRAILEHPVGGHVVLIDDAREFDGTRGYPTIAGVDELVHRSGRDSIMELRHDLIRVYPHR